MLKSLVQEQGDAFSFVYFPSRSNYFSNVVLTRGWHSIVLRLLNRIIAEGLTVPVHIKLSLEMGAMNAMVA